MNALRHFCYFAIGFLVAVLAGLLTGCASTPIVPETVTVVVEKMIPVPEWATKPIVKPLPSDGTVGATLVSDYAKGTVIDLMNCHRALLRKLGAGLPADPKECGGD
jgi:hypothetical protein